jgi:hypothetical protein
MSYQIKNTLIYKAFLVYTNNDLFIERHKAFKSELEKLATKNRRQGDPRAVCLIE